jgi:transcription elongation factor Elf1
MSFTDQVRRIATLAECNATWSGEKYGKRFRCYLCGHKFVVGDGWRFVLATHLNKGLTNFLVCDNCDGKDVLEKWEKANKEAKTRFWWLMDY